MAFTFSLSFLVVLSTLFVLFASLNFVRTYEDFVPPIKRNAIVSWLRQNKNKNHNYRPDPDEVYNVDPNGNCREIFIDLNLERNFIPSVIQHVYCHNMNDPESNHCLYKDLICHQKTELMLLADKSQTCMKGPEEHLRPMGCECKPNLNIKK